MKTSTAQLPGPVRQATGILGVVFFLILFSIDSLAEEDSDAWTWIDDYQTRASSSLVGLARDLDDWVSGQPQANLENGSFLRLRAFQQLDTRDGYHSRLKLDGRLDLPALEERLRLIVESDINDLNPLGEAILRDNDSGTDIGALSWLATLNERLDISHDIGLRISSPFDPFYRFRLRFRHSLAEDWLAGFNQRFWYFAGGSWGYDSEIYTEYFFPHAWHLELALQANYKDDRRRTHYAEKIRLDRSLGNGQTLSAELAQLRQNPENRAPSDRYLILRYRRQLQRDWVYLEIAPQLIQRQETNWSTESGIQLNIELLLRE